MDAPPKRRWLRMQFGLRTVLVLMTLAAIGVAMWTRWPYAVEEKVAQQLWLEPGWAPPGYAQGPYNNNVVVANRESAYYRRLLGGERVRHGESTLSFVGGQRLVERQFREGVLHGKYREWHATTGGIRTEGEYNRGRKHGKWVLLRRAKREEAEGDYRRTQNWNLGVPHGEWKWEDGYGTVYLQVTYDTGRVTKVNGEPVIDYLDDICRNLPSGTIYDRWRLFHRYQANGGYPEWMQDPLARWPSLDVEYDPRLPRLPVGDSLQVISNVPYAVSLAMEMQRTGRAATRRFNVLFITDPQLIDPRHDPTGVSSLDPGPGTVASIQLAKNMKFTSSEYYLNFRQALTYLKDKAQLPLDDSQLSGTLEPRDEDRSWVPIGQHNEEHNIRDLLGLALHRARCRCELIDGVLVIQRQLQ